MSGQSGWIKTILYCTVLYWVLRLSDIWLNGNRLAIPSLMHGQAEGDIYTLTVREKVTSLQNIHPLNA